MLRVISNEGYGSRSLVNQSTGWILWAVDIEMNLEAQKFLGLNIQEGKKEQAGLGQEAVLP